MFAEQMALTWTSSATVVLLFLLGVIYMVSMVTYRLYFHPLWKYPGPLLARVSGLYMLTATLRCHDTYTRDELHRKYGSVVRTGPNELSFVDGRSIKDIYGQSSEPCLKSPSFYGGFTLTGSHSVFSTTDRHIHARMRRLLSHSLSERGVLNLEDVIQMTIETYLSKIAATEGSPIDLHDITHDLFLDTTSQLSFGKSFEILRGGDRHGARDIDSFFNICPVFGSFPAARYLPFGPFRAAREAQPRIVRYVKDCIRAADLQLEGGTTQYSLMGAMIAVQEKSQGTFTETELIENAVIFIIAGSGTTASTFLYTIYEVGRRPQIYRKLIHELRSALPDHAPVTYESVAKLPFLNCVIQEVLRLRGPIPTVAPRISPGKVIAGAYVPAGVTVSNLAYSTHRDPQVFPDALAFVPERWENTTPEMKIMHRPFSTGPRNCVGMHLAKIQLLLSVCSFYRRFDVELDPRMTQNMMVQRDQGTMTVSGKQLWVRARATET